MSFEAIVELRDVWKAYPLHNIFHRSLREDIANLFRKRPSCDPQNEFLALQGVSLQVARGSCIGLYGHNGAGKSTILKVIARVTYPDRGEVRVRGRVAPLIEIGAGFHPDLTGRENIFVNGTILGMSLATVRQRMEEIIAFAELDKFIDLPIKKYSSGMYLRLGFSVAIHSGAEILLLDEILAVGDVHFQEKCMKKILELKGQGCTVVVVSHDRQRLEKVCDSILTVERGKVLGRPR